jgi:transposase-like protein
VEFIELQRWGENTVDAACPHCGDVNVYKMMGRDGLRERNYRWRCRGCKAMFSVRTKTILEETRLPLSKWLHCYWRAVASKKGVSALQISRECEISYKSALFLMHRLRFAMSDLSANRPKLDGEVEADECYVGPRRPRFNRGHNKRGRGTKKTPVVGIVQRGGDVRFQVMERVNAAELKVALAENVDTSATLYTDESNAYTKVGREFEGGHETVNHSRGEYARRTAKGVAHSNSIEGCFALLKRGIYGTFHSVSKKHLHRYCAEFEFRFNARNIDDGERLALAIKKGDGKRLTYADQVGAGAA